MHTCDQRDTRTNIASSYPHFMIEEGFTELDELWHPTIRESKAQVAERARKVLDVIFEKDTNALCRMNFAFIFSFYSISFGSCFYNSSRRFHKWIFEDHRKATFSCTDGR